MKERMKKTNGITLVALVVTIVVLLILAGVSINLVVGQNGLITKSKEAKNKTEVTTVQELARLAYSEAYMDDLTKEASEVMNIVVSKLNEDGYPTVLDTSEGDVSVTGITLSDERISLVPTSVEGDTTKDITVSLVTEGDVSSLNYLVTISGKQHKMSYQNGKLEIDERPIQTNVESEIYKLIITPKDIVTNGSVIVAANGENITAEKEIDITNNVTLTVTSTETEINTVSDVVSLALKSNLDIQIGEIKNLQVAVEKIYDFTITQSNRGAIGYTDTTTDLVIPETFVGDGNNGTQNGVKYRIIKIGQNAFANNYNLITVTIPDTVTEIASGAFIECKNLKTINIGKNLEKIVQNEFYNCSSLENYNVNYENQFFKSVDGILLSKDGKTIWRVPAKNPTESFELDDTVKIIKSYAFYKCNNIKKIKIPDGIETIEAHAFGECKSLKEVYLGEGVERIEGYTFRYCSALKEVYIPSTIKSLGYLAFESDSIDNMYYNGSYEQYQKITGSSYFPYNNYILHCTDITTCKSTHMLSKYTTKISPTTESMGKASRICDVCKREFEENIPQIEDINSKISVVSNGNYKFVKEGHFYIPNNYTWGNSQAITTWQIEAVKEITVRWGINCNKRYHYNISLILDGERIVDNIKNYYDKEGTIIIPSGNHTLIAEFNKTFNYTHEKESGYISFEGVVE